MTGYSSAANSADFVDLEVSVRSVNGRFLDLRMHIPREYAELENDLKKTFAQTLQRGTVDVYIARRVRSSSSQAHIKVDADLAKKWLKSYRQLGKELKMEDDTCLELVARQPEVLQIVRQDKISIKEKNLLLKTVGKALAGCQKERIREGKSLQKDISNKLKELEQLVGVFGRLRAQANKELSKRYQQRLQKLELGRDIDPQRLAQEVVIQIDKSDINEEIIRLQEHLRAMKSLVNGKNSNGKKLDFYSQELLREVNTIGSKSQIARLTQSVVDAKAIIERIREQVQNIE